MGSASPYSIASSSRRSDSIVYRGQSIESALPVMLKVPHSRHPKQMQRLKNEYEIGGVLEGVGVLRPIALELFQGSPALVLEDFGGESLEELLGAPVPVQQFLPLAIRIA